MQKVLNTTTRITRIGFNIDIFTFYTQREEDILAFISEQFGDIDGVKFKENELGYSKKGYTDVTFFINNEGELIVSSNNPDRFAVDQQSGQLQITE
jgi:hypothetical protein